MPAKPGDASNHRGFAYVEFKTSQGVRKAERMSGKRLNGKPLYVAQSKQTGSTKGMEAPMTSTKSRRSQIGKQHGQGPSKDFQGETNEDFRRLFDL